MVNAKNNSSGKKTFGVSLLTRLAIFSVFVGTLGTYTFSNNGECSNNQLAFASVSNTKYSRCLAEKGESSASCSTGKKSKQKSSKKKDPPKKNSNENEPELEDEECQFGLHQEVNEEELEQLGNMFQELSEKLNVGQYLEQYRGDMEEFAKKFEEGDGENIDMDFCNDLFGKLADSLIETYAKDTSDEKKTKMKANAQKATNKLLKYCLKEKARQVKKQKKKEEKKKKKKEKEQEKKKEKEPEKKKEKEQEKEKEKEQEKEKEKEPEKKKENTK
ncbi:Plasmodium exported protein, unknown function [Plasmodium knowlesi strain H]|uniref:Uncharacterized protein n=3 Tax=Plasmodium knowlesi TaxID=5850 RepID=A0A5K1VRN8_PLAKH|nr:Plasmodium exported protein, unknown function [Plasmodium knowlesi strain H]OTN64574.1 Uncharacterized protein PKNOH_S130215900 [Plasmodium knowlesi]CAA9989319.1 Plasmodium exported protein, unknown function [Plasmodium knowlesi strain H]SBO26106.1 Plasmodium exported protein, unknown function [Plasmodium knowlesi strain H]SBO26756.1 Plasmodium exported protein, unknown function [Plasmodium knowlesi strain H]VVS78793.1 Plasmodium exported protein, unknown function [Plasmodium knowlesi strai|eukprot:XP_002261666.1 hypothetical protein, conserved in Plasmodium species [Plasmodium knowlesi strain H]